MAKRKAASKKQKYKVGQIVAIPLPDKRFAYGKVFNDFDLGIYNYVSKEIEAVEKVIKKKFLFYNAVTDSVIEKGTFKVIGEQPFANEESAWAPPMATGIYPDDPDIGVLHIIHKGEMWRAEPSEAAGMDVRSICTDAESFVEIVVERLVDKNHRSHRYKP